MMTYSVVFLIVASPLLVRNAIRFGSPTYNVNSYLLWVDAYESPNALAEQMTLKEARSAYLASHTITDMLKREVTGLVWEAFIGLRTLGIAPWSDARVLIGFPLFLLGLIGLSHAPRSASLVLVVWTITTWGVMAWYVPIAAGDRFVMPLLVPWLVLAADGLARIPDMTRDARTATRRIAFAVLLLGAISTVFVWVSDELWTC